MDGLFADWWDDWNSPEDRLYDVLLPEQPGLLDEAN